MTHATKVSQAGRRILFVIGSLQVGGAERQMTALARELAARGWKVFVFALDADGPLRDALASSGCVVCGGSLLSGGGRIYHYRVLSVAIFRLCALIVRHRIEVVQGLLPLTNFMAAVAGRLTFRDMIITSRRGLGTHQDKHPQFRRLDRIANHLSHVVTANSEAVADDVSARDSYPRNRIIVIRNGIYLNNVNLETRRKTREALRLTPNQIALVKVANLLRYKGHSELIDAVSPLMQESTTLHLFLIGEDRGELKGLQRKIQLLGIEQRVHFLGQRQDVPQLLAGMDVGVIASHEEGFSNALLEKLAAGLPIVATDVGGNREALKGMPNCYLVRARSARALTLGLMHVLRNLPEQSEPTIRARQVLSQYTIQAMTDAYEALYSKHDSP